MSHLQATHPRQAELRAAPPAQLSGGKQQAAQAVRSLVSRYTSRCASSEVARGVGRPGRVQWAASLRPAPSGSAGRPSAASLELADRPDHGSSPPRENRSRSRRGLLGFLPKSWRGVTYVVLLTRAWPGVSRLVPFAPGVLCLGGGKAPKHSGPDFLVGVSTWFLMFTQTLSINFRSANATKTALPSQPGS